MELLIPEPPPEAATPAPAATEPAQEAFELARPTTDPYAIGPDTHERVPDEDRPRVTDKGLPKRTPKISAPAPVPRPRTGGVDAEALRRRLGGFHRGAMEGRRDVEAEIAEKTAEMNAPAGHAPNAHPLNAQDVEAPGGTVEEASS
jgi:hypothetical protein